MSEQNKFDSTYSVLEAIYDKLTEKLIPSDDILKEQFATIGYSSEFVDSMISDISEDIAYTKTKYDKWDPNNTSAYSLYSGDTELVYAPNIDTSKVTTMNYMFQNCSSLTTIPQLDTSNVADMQRMFQNCSSLITIPQLDTSNVARMNSVFSGCSSLITIPQLDTSNVTNMQDMFQNCSSLITIPQLDTSKVTNMGSMFWYSTSLTTLGGLLNCKVDLSLSHSNNLTHESLMNVINNLYDLTSNGLGGKTLTLGSTNLNKLTADEIAIATNKGWTVK